MAAISTADCIHHQHSRFIFLADCHWDRFALWSSNGVDSYLVEKWRLEVYLQWAHPLAISEAFANKQHRLHFPKKKSGSWRGFMEMTRNIFTSGESLSSSTMAWRFSSSQMQTLCLLTLPFTWKVAAITEYSISSSLSCISVQNCLFSLFVMVWKSCNL